MMTRNQTDTLTDTNYPGIISGQGSCTTRSYRKDSGQQILFYFMDRFTNSRSWQAAITLAACSEWMEDRNIIVILVGDYDNLLPATRFAFELRLPFLLLADHKDALWQRYGKPALRTNERQNAYVLVDGRGKVRYSLGADTSADVLETSDLLRAISRSC